MMFSRFPIWLELVLLLLLLLIGGWRVVRVMVVAGRRKLVWLLGRVGVGGRRRNSRQERLFKKLEPLGYLGVGRSKLGGTAIGIDGV